MATTARQVKNFIQREKLLEEHTFDEAYSEFINLETSYQEIRKEKKVFFGKLIKQYGINSICDLACQNGLMLKLFADAGIAKKKLLGVSSSKGMLKLARKNAGAGIRLAQARLDKSLSTLKKQKFDMFFCGNDQLTTVLADESLITFFKRVHRSLNPGGIFMAELMNYKKVWNRREKYLPLISSKVKGKDHLFMTSHDFHEELIIKNKIHIQKARGEWYLRAISQPIRPITTGEIEYLVEEAKFSKHMFMGDYAPPAPYRQGVSPLAILIAKK